MVNQKYKSYDEVPFYRKQLFFWVFYLLLSPIAIIILLFGDIYYQRESKIYSFGLFNRIIAILIAVNILHRAYLYFNV